MPYSPRPICPEPYCGKIWSPTKAVARQLHAEVVQEKGGTNRVRYYEHAGGWHWTSDLTGRTKPLQREAGA